MYRLTYINSQLHWQGTLESNRKAGEECLVHPAEACQCETFVIFLRSLQRLTCVYFYAFLLSFVDLVNCLPVDTLNSNF